MPPPVPGWRCASLVAGTSRLLSRYAPFVAGYANGVPWVVTSVTNPAQGTHIPVAGMKDPIGGNLDRVQVVKGWLDAKGNLREQVYDVAWSGGRKPGADGKLASVGSTVDVATATWTNTIGAPELVAVWKDPDFDPQELAFYYTRVIEIPTPRWTAYDAQRFGVEPQAGTMMTVTERAYTSPIWSPRKRRGSLMQLVASGPSRLGCVGRQPAFAARRVAAHVALYRSVPRSTEPPASGPSTCDANQLR